MYTKTKTSSGLPNGLFGLLGAVEDLSDLALLAILVYNIWKFSKASFQDVSQLTGALVEIM